MDIRKKLRLLGSMVALTTSLGLTGTTIYATPIALDTTSLMETNTEERNQDLPQGGGYAATGQLPEIGYVTQVYNETNGLPTSDITCVLGASDGFIWIGSYSGVVRYDGTTFTQMDRSEGLTSARGLFEDSHGRIWAGTNDNGVVIIHKNQQTHLTYLNGLPSSSIRTFAEGEDDRIYIGTTAGVCYVDKDLKVHRIDDARLNDKRVLKLETDLSGRIIGQTSSGEIFAIEGDELTSMFSSEELGMPKITGVAVDQKNPGMIYISTETSYLYYGYYGMPSTRMIKISVAPMSNLHYISYECGRLWLTSITQVGYLDEHNNVHVIDNLPMDSAIEMLSSDYQGNIWLASSSQGTMKIVASNFMNLNEMFGIEPITTNAVCYYHDVMYLGTEHGLQIVRNDGQLLENELTELIGDNRVRCLMEDADGNLWISVFTNDVGLLCYNEATGDIKRFNEENGLLSNEVRCTNLRSDGSVIAATNNGLVVIQNLEVIRAVGSNQNLHNTVFLSVCEGDDGEIMCGTDGDGIYIFSENSMRRIGRDEGLTSDVVTRIIKDTEHNLYWILTSNSIQYIQDGKVHEIRTLPFTNNYDLFINDTEDLWVMASNGVYSLKVMDALKDDIDKYHLYTISKGLPAIPTSHCYNMRMEDGYVLMATRAGVVKFNSKMSYAPHFEVKLGISSITCDGEEILVNDKNGKYSIPADSSRIQIMPAVLDYTVSDPMVHVYIAGADESGIYMKKSNLDCLEYTGLDYGEYVLHVQIIDELSGEVYQDKTFGLIKQPQFFELFTTRIIMLLLVTILAGVAVWRILNGTIIRRQYEELIQAKDEAERANTAKTRFLANISHEIRTPINTIMGMDEMILREDATGVPKEYFMSVLNYAMDIRTASESLLGLINDLLDISKVESGKMHLVEQEYSVTEQLRAIIPMVRVRSEQKDLKFILKVDETIPRRLYGDCGKVKQILLNLLTNAIKYTPSGSVTLTLLLTQKTNDTCTLRFSVKDTGIGIKEEDIDKLFTSYERLDEVKNSAIQGTGLGLDISKKFAELMNGTLECKSVYGEGSEFIFEVTQDVLDRKAIGVFEEHSEEERTGPYVPQFIAPDASILVVDDNKMNLEVTKNLLKATKMFITTAESGEECLERIKYGKFDLVLLDHMMPGMDGVQTLERIRMDHPDLPVYALTANTSVEESFYVEKGFNGYLAKPIDTVQLERTILKHLPEDIVMKMEDSTASKEEEKMPEEMDWLGEVEDISVEAGLRASGGVTSYIFALQLFYDTIENNAKVIEDALENKDYHLYTVKVHALKTSARIVGATELSEEAKALEDAGKHDNIGFIEHNHKRMMEHYRSYLTKLKKLYKDEGKVEETKEKISKEDLQDAYKTLKEMISQMDYDSVEMIVKQLQEYELPEEDAARLTVLEKALKSFDWDGMEELMESL